MIAETIEETDMPALAALKDISLSIAADAFVRDEQRQINK